MIDHVQRLCGGIRQIEHAVFGERPAVVDDNCHAAMGFGIGDAQADSVFSPLSANARANFPGRCIA